MIKTLEESFKVGMRENDFEVLMNHFNKKCFFCGKDGNGHKTFVGRNGLDYFEYHHFILQCVAKKFPELQDIIDFHRLIDYPCAQIVIINFIMEELKK